MRRIVLSKYRSRLASYALISLPVGLIFIWLIFPIFYALYVSFFKWNLLGLTRPFIGLGNYIYLFQDPRFFVALRNTAYYVGIYVPSVTIIGLALALMGQKAYQSSKLRTWIRSICFMPVITSLVAISVIWMWLYQPSFGLLNYLLGKIGLGPYKFLKNPKIALNSIITMTTWKYMGYTMIIYIAGLVSIPAEYYDAAKVDGVNTWQEIWYITLPLLKNVTAFLLVTQTITAFQVFTQTFVMTRGGPGTATDTIVMEIYFRGFQFLRMGEAAALSYILFAIILVGAIFQVKLLKTTVAY